VERTKGELFGELRARIISTTIKDISPNGAHLEMNIVGQVKGKIDREHVETAHVLLRPDGTGEWESKAIQTTKEGDILFSWGEGKGHSTGPMKASWEGEVHFMTKSPRLSWLNNTTVLVEGTTDRAAGEYQGKAYTKK